MLNYKEITGSGFHVMLDYENWRIASLTYDAETNDVYALKNFGRHHQTVEAFVLIEGEASMLTAGFDKIPAEYEITAMKKNSIYYVKESQWHAALLTKNAKMLIFENRNTDETNSEKYFINNSERKVIVDCFKKS